MKKQIILLLVITLGGYQWLTSTLTTTSLSATGAIQSTDLSSSGNERLYLAIERQQSKIQVQGTGLVSRMLADDTKGARHQKFLLRLASDQTILIAHNIDLAPRIDSLKLGDKVEFFGQYEWNNKGGLVHWTHHDPQGKHIDGWLKHNGKIYQ